MAAMTLSLPKALSSRNQRANTQQAALEYINSIESTWRGHEEFIFWLVKTIRPKTVVDLGFDRGLSTISFSYQNKGLVFGIDWFDDTNYATKCFALDSAFRNISDAIRFHYVKNIHLIIGPFREIAKTWKRKIDILHIDWSHTYQSSRQHYENWSTYLQPKGIVLVHDVLAFPNETGRFFEELPMHKFIFPHAQGLGCASHNEKLIDQIRSFAAV